MEVKTLTPEEVEQMIAGKRTSEPRRLENGIILVVYEQLFNSLLTLSSLNWPHCYDNCWEYETYEQAIQIMNTWDGTGEPSGWIRHPPTHRFRPNGDPAKEFLQNEI